MCFMDVSRVYFEGAELEGPGLIRRELRFTEGIGGKFFFSIATHGQAVPILLQKFCGQPGGFEDACGVSRKTARRVGDPRKNFFHGGTEKARGTWTHSKGERPCAR
ncbi:hypothetical protein MPNT_10048 [Candidatus Methylacidithermus pantelleriae]|uniref:Uncharacterized protein n=1 Tax=Candidatus Methylacidithermus pantelleriae TaxID=2744239 RepID=A0A8J2BQC7_9BACT|nr:hypothetical protein MPNT_10048 [Candidatus Methylacidithermus pantelleriae]